MVDYGLALVCFARRWPLIVPVPPTDITTSDCVGLAWQWPMSVQRWCFQYGTGCLHAAPVSSLECYHPLMRDWHGAGTYCMATVITVWQWPVKLSRCTVFMLTSHPHNAISFFSFSILADFSPYWDMVLCSSFTLITHPSFCSPHLMHHQKVSVFFFVNKFFEVYLYYFIVCSFSQHSNPQQTGYFMYNVFVSNFSCRFLLTNWGLGTL